ncbi:MAG: WG repeat-containing protein, partial [Bacteroidia bacterium]|nr:WG repeat-containing protein [Bacteroidia bacterium]
MKYPTLLVLLFWSAHLSAQIDSSATAISAEQSLETWPASEGRIRFRDGDFGFQDSTGKVVVSAQYEVASDFSQGLARVGKGGEEGFIRKDGSVAISLEYSKVWSFRDSVAMVKLGTRYGFIDHSGEWIITPDFDHAQLPEEGMILVKKDGRFGYFSTKGDLRIPLAYEEATPFFQGK